MSQCPVEPPRDEESCDWLAALRGPAAERDEAIGRLHALLLRAARYQLGKMGEAHRLGRVRREELVQASADEAVVAVLARLDSFEGRSRFTTWAYKFAILQTATTVRREVWRHREVDLASVPEPASPGIEPAHQAEVSALTEAIRRCITQCLTPHQQRVLRAIVIDGVPIDVVAERLGTTRNTVYKTLHDARKRLRLELTVQGYLEAKEDRR